MARTGIVKIKVFKINGAQAVRLPKAVELPEVLNTLI